MLSRGIDAHLGIPSVPLETCDSVSALLLRESRLEVVFQANLAGSKGIRRWNSLLCVRSVSEVLCPQLRSGIYWATESSQPIYAVTQQSSIKRLSPWKWAA